jgi:hypothetical protein
VNNALRSIDLSSYSTSLGWAGYFDAKKGISRRSNAEAIITLLLGYIHQHRQKITLCSSLTCFRTERQLRAEGYRASEARALYARAINRSGLIQDVDIHQPDALPQLCIRDIELSRGTQAGFLAVIEAILAQSVLNGGFVGQFFIVFEGSGLVIYPHDEGGFGAFDSQPGQASNAFFAHFYQAGFEVVLKSRHAPIQRV